MSVFAGIQSHYRIFGVRGIFEVAKCRISRRPTTILVRTHGIAHPLRLRLRTTDVSVFEEIILNAEYSIEPANPPRVIVDAGANIGLTSVFFANRFPEALIFAIEPEPSNFEMLQINAAPYPKIVPVHAALWKESTHLKLTDPGAGSWGFQTEECRAESTITNFVRGMTLDELMTAHDCDYIDVLKIDVEGAEKEIFETSASWIDRVGAILVELHDRDKAGCSRSLYRAAADFTVEWRKGETTFLFRPSSRVYVPNADGAQSHPATGVQRLPDQHTQRSKIVSVQT